MTSSLRLAVGLLICLFGLCNAARADSASEQKTRQTWQILDYLAVDYGGAVEDGKVKSADEYAEMQEFAQTSERNLAELPDGPAKARLLQEAAALKNDIAAKAGQDQVGRRARGLAAALLAAYPVPVAPSKMPDLQAGAKLYQAQCASCHGAEGRGNGPLAARLSPPPADLTDHERASQRSLFGLHQIVTQGISGTSMPAFSQLSDDERWALAFFVSSLSYTDADRQAGQKLWKENKVGIAAAIPNIAGLTQLSEMALAEKLPPDQARAALAFLRSNPENLAQSRHDSLAVAQSRLKESLAALQDGKQSEAVRLALSAYLDGFEPVEPALAVKDKNLFDEIEKTMGSFRNAVTARDMAGAAAIEGKLQGMLGQAQEALASTSEDPLGVFIGALTILLREGLEALLIVVAMIAFLKKAQRQDVIRYVHAGWTSALAAGGLTWFIATSLVDMSGASRELTEGFSAIFAAVVLLSVGVWMHQKSLAGRWQAYVKEKLSSALNRSSAMMLFVLAFVTVYREVFETVLFYAALWTEGNGIYLLSGLGTGLLILAGVALVMLKTSSRLPISQFFAASSALVAILSFVLIGKGVAALQEAGMLGVTPVPMPRIDLLGMYPSLQSVAAQVVVVLIIIASVSYNLRSTRSPR
ncbi:high-affinity iron transporter [Noviherbaspirillum humi]|uniref:High-affinity iron transporter n=1 Tax=Noviherbaspirillum humi TaxID=1688639 RepID=A0A239DRJ9_9BURK|nr:cytochrome c/FTR1 family iron permease [Noviherbaspirillum humi]SNS34741.1 high-affinity iron transporter [Noviherbaspirillum humi]